MGDHDFEIPAWVDEAFLLKVLRSKYPNEEDLQVHKITVEVGINKGDGFASEIFRVVVDSSMGTFPLLLKKPHEMIERYEIVKAFDLFNREITFYSDFYPEMKAILESVDEFEEFAPEMFYAEAETDLLVLRDLRGEGYKNSDRHQRVSKEAAEIVLRKLAKFHASSLILNKKWSGKLEKRKFNLFDGSTNDFFCQHFRVLIKDMETWGSEFEQIIPKLEAVERKYQERLSQNVTSKRGLDLLIHGDPWFNNLLIKNGDPLDVLLIDFQTASWGTLAVDLIYFTITSLNEEDFEDREEFLRVYHGHLDRVLKKLKWEREITYEDVLKEYKDKFCHAIYSSLAKLMTSVDPQEQSFDVINNQGDDAVAKKLQNPRINKELRNTVRLMDLYGVLE